MQIVSYVTLPISTHCEQIIAVHGVNTTGMGISEHVNFFKKRGGGNKHFTSNLIKHTVCIINCFSPAYNPVKVEVSSQLRGIYIAQPRDVHN